VPYIVRLERGTMNRGIYDIAVLFDPIGALVSYQPTAAVERQGLLPVRGQHGSAPAPVAADDSWTDDRSLSRGYLVAQNSLTDSSQNSTES
jgi:hypothetical protein